MKSIHEIIEEKVGLAKTYAEDGAFHSAARVLRGIAARVEDHAVACDAHERSMIAQEAGK